MPSGRGGGGSERMRGPAREAVGLEVKYFVSKTLWSSWNVPFLSTKWAKDEDLEEIKEYAYCCTRPYSGKEIQT
ncbi:hypothetical protein XENTR_v10006235 [Xenopus tropicalis]|nr:hypothetical protein XENTR_v10006235 [Xenopus tropicalis]